MYEQKKMLCMSIQLTWNCRLSIDPLSLGIKAAQNPGFSGSGPANGLHQIPKEIKVLHKNLFIATECMCGLNVQQFHEHSCLIHNVLNKKYAKFLYCWMPTVCSSAGALNFNICSTSNKNEILNIYGIHAIHNKK